MDFTSPYNQYVQINIPPWYTVQNALDVYKYLLENRLARWILFIKADQVCNQATDIIVVDHPILMIPFFFHPSHTDRMFVDALNSRINSPIFEDLYPV